MNIDEYLTVECSYKHLTISRSRLQLLLRCLLGAVPSCSIWDMALRGYHACPRINAC